MVLKINLDDTDIVALRMGRLYTERRAKPMKRLVLLACLLAILLVISPLAEAGSCSNPNSDSCEASAASWLYNSCIPGCLEPTCYEDEDPNVCYRRQERCIDSCRADWVEDLCDCEVVYCPLTAQCGAGQGG